MSASRSPTETTIVWLPSWRCRRAAAAKLLSHFALSFSSIGRSWRGGGLSPPPRGGGPPPPPPGGKAGGGGFVLRGAAGGWGILGGVFLGKPPPRGARPLREPPVPQL